MDTYEKFHIDKYPNLKDIVLPMVSEEDARVFDEYLKLDAVLQEIEQLNQLFLFNLYAFAPYILKADDSIVTKATGEDVDAVTLNALFINLISSGKVLMDMVEVILENDLPKNRKDEFREQCTAPIYDNRFSYRFFGKLRNICQHGYLPVSKKADGRFCFDFFQIKELRHIKHNKAFLREIDNIIRLIAEKHFDAPNICFVKYFDEYVKTIFEIYYRFLDFIRLDVEEVCGGANNVTAKNSEYVCKEQPYKNMVVYEGSDGLVHIFPAEIHTLKFFMKIRSGARKRFRNHDRDNHIVIKVHS